MNDKRVALSIVEQNNPFNMVSIKGKVIDQTTELSGTSCTTNVTGSSEHINKRRRRLI
ncbi:MAG: hypothetical protein WA323_22770 [Candidatus Nitrosopolaris sp.]